MRILIDISHPAHVHFFRNAVAIWQEHGHTVGLVARDKDLTCDLLQRFRMPFKVLSRARTGLPGWILEMMVHTGRLFPVVAAFRPHVMLQIGGTFVAPVGRLTRTPTWAFTDTENAGLSNAVTFPMVHRIFTPECYLLHHGAKHRRYAGFHELAYLHPRRFVPDPSVLAPFGLKPGDRFFVVRFVGWQAAHDLTERGFGVSGKIGLVTELARQGRVFVSSEAPLPDPIRMYESRIPIHQMHHFLAYATLVVGESATMTSEAAVLGTPAIFVSRTGRGYTDTQERKYGLVCNFTDADQIGVLNLVNELMVRPNLREDWQKKRRKLLIDTIDVTGWLVGLVERFGETGDADASADWALAQVASEERLEI